MFLREAICFGLVAAVMAQDPVVVVAKASEPITALAEQLAKRLDQHMLFDTGHGVFVPANELRSAWLGVGRATWNHLRELADRVAVGLAPAGAVDADARAVASIARVVVALLADAGLPVGTCRRRDPRLVRIPMQWRGRTVKALAPRLEAEFVPDPPRPTLTLSLRGVPAGAYALHIVHESGAVVDASGTASGEHALVLPPGPCTLHVLRADGSEFAQRVFKVGDTAPQTVELDLRVR